MLLLLAKFMGIVSFGYEQLIVDAIWIYASVGIFLFWISSYTEISVTTRTLITVIEFANWLAIFWYTIFFLNEIRMVALFFSIIALVFMLSHSNFITSIAITLFFAITYIIITYICINFLQQKGHFTEHLYYVLVFVPTGIYISWMS